MNFTPFQFQNQLKDYFKAKENIWQFFSSYKIQENEYESFKTDILKNCYRLGRDLHPNYHQIIDEIKTVFQIDKEVILYQEQNNMHSNASVYYLNNEAHIILTGPLLQILSIDEIKVILAHELSHVLLYTLNEGDFQTTERIINAITDDMRSPSSYFETSRLYALYTELFCDYGSYLVCQNRDLVISTLVKVHTGLKNVFAQEYLEQINEIFEKDKSRTEQKTHPEMYFRAKSLELLCQDYEQGKKDLVRFIDGNPEVSELGIFSQKKWQLFTFEFIQIILLPIFMQSSLSKNLAKTYFDNFNLANSISFENKNLINEIEKSSVSMKEYFCYILFDFTLIDKEIYEMALIWTLQLSEYFGLKEPFEKIVKKELRLSELRFKDLYKKSLKSYQNLPSNQTVDLSNIFENNTNISQ